MLRLRGRQISMTFRIKNYSTRKLSAVNLKTLITLGFLAMLALLLAIGGYAYYSVNRLDHSSRNVLKDNFYSV